MVPSKGVEPHAVKVINREIKLSGYIRMTFKSDQEPSIQAILEAVKREKGEALELQLEESRVGEHQSNGEVENAIRSIQSRIRTMRLALHSRYQAKIGIEHPIMPWLIHHAALLTNFCRVGTDGRTSYERRKGKCFNRLLPEIGECIWYLKP